MLGIVDHQAELLDADQLCGHLVPEDSIHRKLAVLGDRLFSDRDFADLYDRARGRHSVPPSLVAKVMLLQSLEGTSDRETVDRVRRDIGWKIALGLSLQDEGFHPTVLTYFRERLRTSANPRRIFDRFKQVAIEAGLLTTRGVRVLDSTPLATVAGQDVYPDDDGNFRIRKGVAKDRVISVVDPDARHGRKSKNRHFDGYQAHVAVDPETELVTEVEVAPASTHEAQLSRDLLPELDEDDAEVTVVADSAYGSGANMKTLQDAGASTVIKTQRDKNTWGGFPKRAFRIDLDAKIATCPAGVTTATIASKKDGSVEFRFPAQTCASCPLGPQCTTSTDAHIGRRVCVGPHEKLLAEARAQQKTDEFKAIYNGKRPTVERVIYRVVRNGGRKARYRGRAKVREQIRTKAAGENLFRMLRLGLVWMPEGGWATA